MMMPANYSVIAENEMTYVVGGTLIEAIGSVTAPIWTVDNVKTFNTNIVTLVGNEFVGKLVQGTVGFLFSGDVTWKALKEQPKKLLDTGNGIGDNVMNFLGLVAGGYNLGNATVANTAGSVSLFPSSAKKWKDSERYVKDADGNYVKQIWG